MEKELYIAQDLFNSYCLYVFNKTYSIDGDKIFIEGITDEILYKKLSNYFNVNVVSVEVYDNLNVNCILIKYVRDKKNETE